MAIAHKSRKTGKYTPVVAVIHKRIRDKEHTKKGMGGSYDQAREYRSTYKKEFTRKRNTRIR